MGEIMQIWNIQKELILNDCDLRQKVPAALPKQPFLSKMQMVNYLWQWLEVHGHERLFTFKIVQEISPMVFYVQVRFFTSTRFMPKQTPK